MPKVIVYTSEHCQPCKIVTDLISQGRFTGEKEIELVDIETDEGFARFSEEILKHNDGAVPSAYKEGKQCLIRLNEDVVEFECPIDAPPASD